MKPEGSALAPNNVKVAAAYGIHPPLPSGAPGNGTVALRYLQCYAAPASGCRTSGHVGLHLPKEPHDDPIQGGGNERIGDHACRSTGRFRIRRRLWTPPLWTPPLRKSVLSRRGSCSCRRRYRGRNRDAALRRTERRRAGAVPLPARAAELQPAAELLSAAKLLSVARQRPSGVYRATRVLPCPLAVVRPSSADVVFLWTGAPRGPIRRLRRLSRPAAGLRGERRILSAGRPVERWL